MIILPDKNIPRAKFLLPMDKKIWRTPSQTQEKDQLGNENHTKFKIIAKYKNLPVWYGWFYDRDDFDAFLWAIATDTIKYEKSLWNLPTPNWQPYLGDNINYEFYTYINLSTPVTTVSTYTFNMRDWNNGNNQIAVISGGAGGGATSNVNNKRGGAGGGYARRVNVTVTIDQSFNYVIGAGGAGATISVAAGNGGQSYFGSNTYIRASGAAGSVTVGAGTAGDVLYSGGFGGDGAWSSTTTTRDAWGGGGGGAAGRSGNGFNGSSASLSSKGGDGGAGDQGFGGAGGSSYIQPSLYPGANGGNGSEFGANFGSGGGGEGSSLSNATSAAGAVGGKGGNGGLYGAGGGGNAEWWRSPSRTVSNGGIGVQGLINISYKPIYNPDLFTFGLEH